MYVRDGLANLLIGKLGSLDMDCSKSGRYSKSAARYFNSSARYFNSAARCSKCRLERTNCYESSESDPADDPPDKLSILASWSRSGSQF